MQPSPHHSKSLSPMDDPHRQNNKPPNLNKQAQTAHVLPPLKTKPLISIGKICDAGCNANFTAERITVQDNHNNIVSQGNRQPDTKLWHSPLQPQNTTTAHDIVQASDTTDLMKHLHAACFSPAKSTFLKAIQLNFLTTFPDSTVANVNKHLPDSIATEKGHLDQRRQGTQSTKKQSHTTDCTPTTSVDGTHKTNYVFATVAAHTKQENQIHADLTGRFPQQSSQGNQCSLISHDHDSNAALAQPIKNRSDGATPQAHQDLCQMLKQHGRHPQPHKLDNEASTALKQFIAIQKTEHQLTPACQHQTNAAERAIRTFKNHFLAGLCSVDSNFPLHLWDRLIEQATITLNLLRQSRINPKLSAPNCLEPSIATKHH